MLFSFCTQHTQSNISIGDAGRRGSRSSRARSGSGSGGNAAMRDSGRRGRSSRSNNNNAGGSDDDDDDDNADNAQAGNANNGRDMDESDEDEYKYNDDSDDDEDSHDFGADAAASRGAPVARNVEPPSLSTMFAQPTHLMHRAGGFMGAKNFAKDARRWLLVNVQSDDDFACHALNRDVWRDELVENLVREGFILWQTVSTRNMQPKFCCDFSFAENARISIVSSAHSLHYHRE